MKKCITTAVLALLLICNEKNGWAQGGYIRFADNLENVFFAPNYENVILVDSLVKTNLSKLSVRRLVYPEHEAVYRLRGYDLNKDKILNELDGFESVDGEKFSPWNYYIETMPCGTKESIYFEIRALQKDSTPIYLQKMISLPDKTPPIISCKPSIKIRLNAADPSVKIYARDLLASLAYDNCEAPANPSDSLKNPAATKFSIMYGGIRFLDPNPNPDPNQTYLEWDCRYSGETIPVRLFAWDAAGNYNVCVSTIQLIDSSLTCIQEHPFRFHDSLELFLHQYFARGKPLIPAEKLIFIKDTLHTGKIMVRRSIRKSNVGPWLSLGYDRNQDQRLNEQDGIDLNQDGDTSDEGEYFVAKGNFIWTPFLDSLPLFCTDFGDSLYLERRSVGLSFTTGQFYQFKQPNFFVNYRFGISKILKPIPDPGQQFPKVIFEGITAQDFLESPFYSCLNDDTAPDHWGRVQLFSSINLFGEKVDSSQHIIGLTCCENGKVRLLNIYAWSKAKSAAIGNILVYSEFSGGTLFCPSDFSCAPPRILQGSMMDPTGSPIADVSVKIVNSERIGDYSTFETGVFSYQELHWGGFRADFHLITPSKTSNPLNGVSTFDLIQIQKHILNLKPFDSPWQYIAADLNRSGSISTLDMIQLRKLILGIDTHFSNNNSWRFIDANHIFQNPAEPLKTYLPETIRVGVLNGIRKISFIGIKIGDLNFSADPSK